MWLISCVGFSSDEQPTVISII